MSIRVKTVFILLLTAMILVIGTGILSRHLVMVSYGEHEKYVVSEAAIRAADVIEEELGHMENTNLDWSNWDDTMLFMTGKAPGFIDENMMDFTFINLGINMMILVDIDGKVVFGKSVDLEAGKAAPTPPEFKDVLPADGPILKHGGVLKGIVSLERDQMLITARPVLDSNGGGPSVGTLIIGKWLDENMRRYISQVSQTELNIREWTDAPLSENSVTTLKEFSEEIVVQELGPDRIRGSISLTNIHNNGGIIIDVEMPREIMAKGKETVVFFNMALVVLSVIFIVAAWVLLEVFVLRRVGMLHQAVSKITRSGDHEIRIPSHGNDELTWLTGSINRMLEELYYSEKALGIILGVTRLPIIVVDRKGFIKAWNQQAQENMGWTAEEAKGRDDLIIAPSERSDFLQFLEFACSSPNMLTYECQAIGKNDTPFEAMIVASSANSPDNEEGRVVMILIDITVRKDAERALRATLDIKDTLLKEIHHRIKNNLQAVSSVLDLGILETGIPEARKVIWDGQARINAMALVHEKLYQSDDPNTVDLKPYVEDLVRNIARTFNREGSAIGLHVDVQDLKLNCETAVSCGLIINELVTNVFKYAYPEGRTGTLKLHLGEQKEGLYSLTVSDDGEGMPSERKDNSMGLRIVESLAHQLDGSFEIAPNGGTSIKVQFREAIEMSSFSV
jgi:PAS domain S-box-containing protein